VSEPYELVYVLRVDCPACNRRSGWLTCQLCRRIEHATRVVEGVESKELAAVPAGKA